MNDKAQRLQLQQERIALVSRKPGEALRPAELCHEVRGRRALNSKTFNMGNDNHKLVIGKAPVHYQDGDDWHDIDLTVTEHAGGIGTDKAPYRLELLTDCVGYTYTSRAGGRVDLELVEVGDSPVSYDNLTTSSDGNQFFWDGVAPGLRLKAQLKPQGVEIFKELADDKAPRRFLWRVRQDVDSKCNFESKSGGYDSAPRGERVMRRLRRLEMVNVEGERETITENGRTFEQFTYEETWTGRLSTIKDRKTRQKEWSSEAVYPVIIDVLVSEQIVANIDDGYQYWLTTSTTTGPWYYNNSTALIPIGYNTGGPYAYDAGFRFQTIGVPQGATITSASLKLWGGGLWPVGGVPATVYADDVDDAPQFANGNLPRGITPTAASSPFVFPYQISPAYGWMTVGVTGIVQEIISRVGWNLGNDMRFAVFNSPLSSNHAVFMDYAQNPALSAILEINYVQSFNGGGGSSGCASGLEASQILVPDTGGEYKAYSLLSLTQRLLRATAGTGMAPHHFITQRGPLQDGDSPLDMRWDAGTLQLLIADSQANRTDYWDARDALVRLLRPNRSFGWPDGVVRPLIFRKWLPMGRQEFGTDLVTAAGSNLVTSITGRFVERGLDPGCVLTITGTVWDNGAYVIEAVPNDYTLQLSANMVADATGGHWNYMRRWGKRDLYCLLEEGPRFDQGPGAQPFTPNGFREALRFVANDPFWYGMEQSETWALPDDIGDLVFDGSGAWFGHVPGVGRWLFATSSIGESVNVVYWGTKEAKPIITIVGPATNPTINNSTTGTTIEMDYAIAGGEIVTINTLDQTVVNNMGTNLQPHTLGDIATFGLSPRPQAADGINQIIITFTAATVASAATMTWRNRHTSLI